jgi:glucose/arabinose dehydrogenase
MKYLIVFALAVFIAAAAFKSASLSPAPVATPAFAEDNGGITLPEGFRAVVVADSLGAARHIAVSKTGDVYVKMERVRDGRGIVRLHDANGDGVADQISAFGPFSGTGIAIKNGYLYASSNSEVFRYKLNDREEPINTEQPEKIITGLIDRREHNSKSIALDDAGNIYVNIGAPSNACQIRNRTKGSPGQDPCPLLDSVGGIWQFRTDKLNQTYKDGERYATGIRNIVALAWNNTANDLYAVQHGRDQLNNLYPELYNEEQSAELPAEEMFRVKKGSDFGWPYCYYDHLQKQKVLMPEYGGDGKKVERCADKQKPIYAFPGHWGPNGLLFYTGTQFPEKYRNGAFIAFHGSWNRAPRPQAGYFVVFLPFKNGMPSGDYEIFADNFAGGNLDPGKARFRPCGLAQGPDGSLYISDDQKGRIWKVMYTQ